MKRIIFFVFLVITTISCKKEVSQSVELGTYEAYQQGFSEMITVTKLSYTGSDDIVEFKNMDEEFKFPNPICDKFGCIEGKPYGLIRGRVALVDDIPCYIPLRYILTIEKNGKATFEANYKTAIVYNIARKENQILLSNTTKGQIVRFSPKLFLLNNTISLTDESLVVSSNDKDYEKYTTIQGEIKEETIILYFYDAQIKRNSSRVSSYDSNYLDIDRIRTEMEQDDVLEFVKKAIYLKKQ